VAQSADENLAVDPEKLVEDLGSGKWLVELG